MFAILNWCWCLE